MINGNAFVAEIMAKMQTMCTAGVSVGATVPWLRIFTSADNKPLGAAGGY